MWIKVWITVIVYFALKLRNLAEKNCKRSLLHGLVDFSFFMIALPAGGKRQPMSRARHQNESL